MGVPLPCVGRVGVLFDVLFDHGLVVGCSEARTRASSGLPGLRFSIRAVVQHKRLNFMEAFYVNGRRSRLYTGFGGSLPPNCSFLRDKHTRVSTGDSSGSAGACTSSLSHVQASVPVV